MNGDLWRVATNSFINIGPFAYFYWGLVKGVDFAEIEADYRYQRDTNAQKDMVCILFD